MRFTEHELTVAVTGAAKSVMAAKAALDDFDQADISVLPALRDVLTALDDLRDLPTTSGSSEWAAKAIAQSDALIASVDRVRAKYQPKQEKT